AASAAPAYVLAADPEPPSVIPVPPAEPPVRAVQNEVAPPPPANPANPQVPTSPPPGSIIITKANATAAPTNAVDPAATAGPPVISPALAEVVRLIQANVGQEVLLAYITNAVQPFYIG